MWSWAGEVKAVCCADAGMVLWCSRGLQQISKIAKLTGPLSLASRYAGMSCCPLQDVSTQGRREAGVAPLLSAPETSQVLL